MQERLMKLEIGNWTGWAPDGLSTGHRLMNTVIVKFKGADVSNEKLQAVFNANVELTGVNPGDLFHSEFGFDMPREAWEKILEAGFIPSKGLQNVPKFLRNPDFSVYGEEFVTESFNRVLLWFLTHGSDIKAEPLDLDSLFTGYSPVVNVDPLMGYGLFE